MPTKKTNTEAPAEETKPTTRRRSTAAGGTTTKKEAKMVTLADIASDAKISTAKARQKLREAGMSPVDGGRWTWKENSRELKAAEKVLAGDTKKAA